jgi:hypothetical protein
MIPCEARTRSIVSRKTWRGHVFISADAFFSQKKASTRTVMFLRHNLFDNATCWPSGSFLEGREASSMYSRRVSFGNKVEVCMEEKIKAQRGKGAFTRSVPPVCLHKDCVHVFDASEHKVCTRYAETLTTNPYYNTAPPSSC